MFVDGLRDPGMTIRESFALEQVEITKGPSSTFAGRGSTGGAINGITKQADSEYDFVKFQGGPGTDEYYRVHLDANKRLSDDLAVRGNLLYADEYVEHNVLNGQYDVDNRGDPNCSFRLRGQLRDGYCIYDEHGAVVGGLNTLMDRRVTRGDFDSDYGVDTTSVYLMDTVDLRWGFSTFLGVRADYFDYANTVVSRSGVTTDYTYSDLLWNGHAGLVYAFADWGNAYFNIVNEAIAAKVFATEGIGEIVDTAIQLVGGTALQTGHPLEDLYRRVRAMRWAEGASDVLRLNLARGCLDLQKGRI